MNKSTMFLGLAIFFIAMGIWGCNINDKNSIEVKGNCYDSRNNEIIGLECSITKYQPESQGSNTEIEKVTVQMYPLYIIIGIICFFASVYKK